MLGVLSRRHTAARARLSYSASPLILTPLPYTSSPSGPRVISRSVAAPPMNTVDELKVGDETLRGAVAQRWVAQYTLNVTCVTSIWQT